MFRLYAVSLNRNLSFFIILIIISLSCLKLAVVHDLAECIVGDITPSDPMGQEEKHRREKVISLFSPSTICYRISKMKFCI